MTTTATRSHGPLTASAAWERGARVVFAAVPVGILRWVSRRSVLQSGARMPCLCCALRRVVADRCRRGRTRYGRRGISTSALTAAPRSQAWTYRSITGIARS